MFCFNLILLFIAFASPAEEDLKEEVKSLRERMEALEVRLEETEEKPGALEAFYDRGFNLRTRDGKFTLNIGGKVDMNFTRFRADDSMDAFLESTGQNLENGIQFRRARFTLKGTVYERFIYKASYDFADIDTEFKDMYVGLQDLPGDSTLKIGFFREPTSLESFTRSSALQFTERSIRQWISPRRSTGVAIFGTALDRRMTWAGGFFKDSDNRGTATDAGGIGNGGASMRVTGLIRHDGDDDLVHAGVAYAYRGEDDIRFTITPENSQAPVLIDTDGYPASDLPNHLIRMDHGNLYSAEAAWVSGPFSTQGEITRFDIAQEEAPNPSVWGFYWSAGYFLTGEHRSYVRKRGGFGTVTPEENFLTDEGGLGAFEIAVRYAYVDIEDEGIVYGGKLRDYTFGLNWFLNPSVRVMANYIHSDLVDVGQMGTFVIRTALDF
jgi:phosphate-selective porin OprO/OprP